MSAPPLLLIPGLLNTASLWQFQLPALSRMTSVTVADVCEYDTITSLAADVIAQAPAETFSLAGFSMGGYIALEMMRQVPERISALALLDTSARPDTPEAIASRRESIRLAKHGFDEVVQGFTPMVIHPSHQDDAGLVQTIMDMSHAVGVDAFVKHQKALMGRIDSRPYLADIQCPTLVLCGREDLLTPLPFHRELARSIPGSKLVVIRECGHLSPLEQPGQVADAMLEWLARANSQV